MLSWLPRISEDFYIYILSTVTRMSGEAVCWNCGHVNTVQDIVLSTSLDEDSDLDAEVRLSYLGGGQDIFDEGDLRDEHDLSTSEQERVRAIRWMDFDEAEPPPMPDRSSSGSPPYHQPQRGLLWSNRFLRSPPKSLWEPSGSEEEPDFFVFPFKVYPKIDPEDDRRSCSPPVSEYW